MTQTDKAKRFRALHQREKAFVIPNPWDAGSTRILAALGFEALATTSSGLAQTLGCLDGNVSLAQTVEHCRTICRATELPVTADLENGFADDPESVGRAILEIAESGVVGASIEDYSGDAEQPIYDFSLAVERVQSAVEAARSLSIDFIVTARAENLLRQQNSFDDTVRRLEAFEAVGADVLYAPALSSLDEVATVCSTLAQPVNVLAPFIRGATVAELSAAGARRISIGGALARATLAPVLEAGREMASRGTFDWLSDVPSAPDIDAILGR